MFYGGECTAHGLIGTYRLSDIDPEAYLPHIL
ncbi:transposase domain-containing protein, partial [Escherichia coli]|nr:transposase domain-containing protein [Escherichia coli]